MWEYLNEFLSPEEIIFGILGLIMCSVIWFIEGEYQKKQQEQAEYERKCKIIEDTINNLTEQEEKELDKMRGEDIVKYIIKKAGMAMKET